MRKKNCLVMKKKLRYNNSKILKISIIYIQLIMKN